MMVMMMMMMVMMMMMMVISKSISKCYKVQMTSINLQQLLDGAFSDLTSLQFLDLSHNHITSLSPLTFQGLSLLSFLDLSHNSIPSINHAFHHMPELVR